jgi:imidazolonepropionase-like amidohydrolase
MRRLCFTLGFLGIFLLAKAQNTFPVNGIAEPKSGCLAFTNATIVKDASTTIQKGTLVIRDGRIVSVGTNVTIPSDAVIVDCSGKFIYPSFIDAYSTYGMPQPQRSQAGFDFRAPAQLTSNQKGAYGWNQALRTDIEGARVFAADDSKAKPLRDAGFGTVGAHHPDGIARGTGIVATLANDADNKVILKEKATAHFSFSKGTSSQSYPSSLMGSIALLRQTFLDADWYKTNPREEGVNLSLKYFNEQRNLPQVFEANDKWQALRADKLGDEFGVQYVIKAGGNEYQRIEDMKATKATFILPLNFPAPMDVDDPAEMRFVGIDQLKHWELAPTNPAAFEKAGIPFCLTATDLSNPSEFLPNLRKAVEHGLTEKAAIEALTKTPASLLGVSDMVGSLDAGKIANFMIASAPVFSEKATIHTHYIQGVKHSIKEDNWYDVKGTYALNILRTPQRNFKLELLDGGVAKFINAATNDTTNGKYSHTGKMVKLSYPQGKGADAIDVTMSGVVTGELWNGQGIDEAGRYFVWNAKLEKAADAKSDSAKEKKPPILGKVTYPFLPYGAENMPKQETILIKNATVWTSDAQGKMEGTDVLVQNGKIASIGKGLNAAGARVIDGTGKHLTPGIIDEHSHIAAASINEGAQSVTSEVRIQDNLNPEDINIYRQLSGGVTTSHILHGSANTIGGQTQLIKLRWGANADGLIFENADPFIKFALGENVKRSASPLGNNRFPDTRMGVEQVLDDAFQRAKDYEKTWKAYNILDAKAKASKPAPRRDLELDALVEIMNSKRFITCHSYVQSEIVAMMRVAEKYGFTLNTFTHILEGYKVADKMKAHGAQASTFSDWWNYKIEVIDAIPQNAAIMQRVGLNVAINSDDAEMARRLNQEAAKSVKYGGMSEEDALKMVTINPAKMLHVDNRVGSIKTGKDADLVLWSDNPLSIYAKAEYSIVDGTVYFDRKKDMELREQIKDEKQRLVKKVAAMKRTPGAGGTGARGFQRPMPRYEIMHTCSDHYHSHGLLVIDADEAGAESE